MNVAWFEGRPLVALGAVVALAALLIVPGLSSDGFWEPHEIQVADQAWQEIVPDRHALLQLESAARAERTSKRPATAGTKITQPVLTEQLITRSVRAFGPSELGARLPLAVLGLIAVAATFLLGWRIGSVRVGIISALVLVSMPLFLFQSRYLTSDIGALCGGALVVTGALGLSPLAGARRGLALSLIAVDLGLIVIGAWMSYAAAGALLGLVVPFGAVGLAGVAWFALDRAPAATGDGESATEVGNAVKLTSLAALVCAIAAVVFVLAAMFELRDAMPGERGVLGTTFDAVTGYVRELGGTWRPQPDPNATFDALFEQIAFGLFPWVAIAPLAVARLGVDPGGDLRRFGGYVLFAWVGLGWLIATVMARRVGPTVFPAVVPVAVAVALWLDDIATARRAGNTFPLLGLFAAMSVLVIGKDLAAFPDKLVSLAMHGNKLEFPAGLQVHRMLAGCGILLGLCLAVGIGTFPPDGTPPPREPFRRALWRWRARAEVLFPIAIALSVVFAGMMTQVASRSLARRLSSKEIFRAYHALARDGDRLAIMGAHGSGPRYYAGSSFETLGSTQDLIKFLEDKTRGFALIRSSDLCAVHKAANAGSVRYHVVDDTSASYLLVSNRLSGSERDKNPLSGVVVRDPPRNIGRPQSANFDDRIELVGVKMPARVNRSDTFEVTLIFKVLKPVGKNWKVFLHFDAGGMRFQGDHDPIQGRCGTAFWQPGDYILDTVKVKAGDPTYPTTTYRVFAGFFVGSAGNWTNMTAKSGNPDEANRVPIGSIQVE